MRKKPTMAAQIINLENEVKRLDKKLQTTLDQNYELQKKVEKFNEQEEIQKLQEEIQELKEEMETLKDENEESANSSASLLDFIEYLLTTTSTAPISLVESYIDCGNFEKAKALLLG